MKWLRILCFILLSLALWELTILFFHLQNFILPSPLEVFLAFIQLHNIILHHTIYTITETLLGLALGIVLGGLAAIVMSASKTLAAWFLPVLVISQAIPTFAIAPLLVIWLGFGLASKVATTVIMLFFPIASALYDGLNRTDQTLLELAQTMQASKWKTFWHVRLPAALPNFSSGLRIATVIAPIGAIVGEWVGSSRGLGYLMLNANARLQIDVMFASLFVIIFLSLSLYFCIDILLKKLIWW